MFSHHIEYLLARLIGSLASHISLKTAHRIGDFFGDLFYYFLRIRRKEAFDNLRIVFGQGENERMLNQILRRSYRHFGRVLMEFARIPGIPSNSAFDDMKTYGREHLEELIDRRKGVLVLSGHLGNWEYLAAVLARFGPDLHVVYRSMKNSAVDALVRQNRERVGMVLMREGSGAGEGVVSAFERGSIVLINWDHRARKYGVMVEFFGKKAYTSLGPASLAIKQRIPVVVAFGIRGEDGTIEVHFEEFSDIDGFPDTEQGKLKFAREFNMILERYIRTYPEQWFWLHRRWKTPRSHR